MIDDDILYSLQNHAKSFMIDIVPVEDSDVFSVVYWLQQAKWNKRKKDMYLLCQVTDDQMTWRYVTNAFVKKEFLHKSPLKAPRLINNPQLILKARYMRHVSSATSKIKKQLRLDTDFNKLSKHINLVWTSGLNRDEIGLEVTQIIEKLNDLGYDDIVIVNTDYSKFESTQIHPIMKTLLDIYRNISRGRTQFLLDELCSMIIGKKTAYVNVAHSDLMNKYKFIATRTSGDCTTTLGNTLLAMLIGDWLFGDLPVHERKLIYLLQSGDDGQYIMPRKYLASFDQKVKDLIKIGMKLDMIITEKYEECDYNSSVLLECYDVTSNRSRLHLSAKLGRLLARAPYTSCKYTGTQLCAYKYQKCIALVNELQLFPGIQAFYGRYLLKYEKYMTIKVFMKYKHLVTLNNIVPTYETKLQLASRYDISVQEYDLLNDVYMNFDTANMFISDNPEFHKISHILKKIFIKDVVEYSNEDLEAFEPYFESDFLSAYEKHYHIH